MMTTEIYRKMMQDAAQNKSAEELDWVNKQMLASKQITTTQYLMIAEGLIQHKLWGKPIKF